MSDPEPCPGNSKGWTFDTLWAAWQEVRKADQDAIGKANTAFEKRMDSTNEWRGALDDQTRRLATIQQVEALKDTFDQQLKSLKEQINRLEDEIKAERNKGTGAGRTWAALAAVIASVVAILGIIFVIAGVRI